ncbi:MAG: hypothetical protein H6809_03755 [Phycisphaeraceae bacterium]|nr:hypothetical protein [Phycisphaeraceae bacterium]
MQELIWAGSIAGSTLVSLLVGAGVLHLLGRLGSAGRAASEWCCRGIGLDLVITWFTALPMVGGIATGSSALGASLGHWLGALVGLVAAVVGQIAAVCVWTVLHELAHRDAVKGPRIVKVLNRTVGRWRNHAAVWWTAWCVPVFFVVRVAEYVVYPPLTWLVRLPRYESADWVRVSRHKFKGLVGHDLIWCLYCDWMTGVWSLGTEMLRNVESFWCPIRFDSAKKCANCRTDFPDIDAGWVPADGDMAQVEAVLAAKQSREGPNAWFGHPVRLTVGGEAADRAD